MAQVIACFCLHNVYTCLNLDAEPWSTGDINSVLCIVVGYNDH